MRRNVFEELEEMLDRMSEEIGEGMGARPTEMVSIPVDVIDEGDRYVVHADVPGYASDEIDLTLAGTRLEIDADREVETAVEDEDRDYVRRERHAESIRRSVTLPEEVVDDEVSAGLEDGVLTVYLPKVHEDEGKQIDIDEE